MGGNISISSLTKEEIADIVASLGEAFLPYRENIIKNGIDGAMLLDCKEMSKEELSNMLDELGIKTKIHQLKIINTLSSINNNNSSSNFSQKNEDKNPEELLPQEIESDPKDVDKLYELGCSYHSGENGKQKNISSAIHYFLKAAEQGHASSMTKLGAIYAEELSVKNLDEAIRYFKMAIEKGNSEAMNGLGKIYRSEEEYKNIPEAIRYLQMGIVRGNENAMITLGLTYATEPSVKNQQEAIRLYKMAIALNGPSCDKSLFNLGVIYVEMNNLKEATECYKLAAEKGRMEAAGNLALLYWKEPSMKNISEAVRYYKFAIEKGHQQSMLCLGLLYQQENSIKNLNEAMRYLQMGVALGHVQCMAALGYIYAAEPTKKSLKDAIHFYQMAAERGDPESANNLGVLYGKEPTIKDENKQIYYYKMAADKGNVNSMYNLGQLYRLKFNDFKQAIHYLSMAADLGYANAMYCLYLCYRLPGPFHDKTQAARYLKLAVAHDSKEAKEEQQRLAVVTCCTFGSGIEIHPEDLAVIKNRKIEQEKQRATRSKAVSQALQQASSLKASKVVPITESAISAFVLTFKRTTKSLNDYFNDIDEWNDMKRFNLFLKPVKPSETKLALSYRHHTQIKRNNKYLTADCMEFIKKYHNQIDLEGMWVDCLCIAPAGQRFDQACEYMGDVYSHAVVFPYWIEQKDNMGAFNRGWIFQESRFSVLHKWIFKYDDSGNYRDIIAALSKERQSSSGVITEAAKIDEEACNPTLDSIINAFLSCDIENETDLFPAIFGVCAAKYSEMKQLQVAPIIVHSSPGQIHILFAENELRIPVTSLVKKRFQQLFSVDFSVLSSSDIAIPTTDCKESPVVLYLEGNDLIISSRFQNVIPEQMLSSILFRNLKLEFSIIEKVSKFLPFDPKIGISGRTVITIEPDGVANRWTIHAGCEFNFG
jgi:TPR repeat protein